MNRAGNTMNLEQFLAWLNPEGMSHGEKYNRERLLGECAAVTKDVYWHFLEMLPPMHFSGSGFAMCEACTDDLRLAFFIIKGRHYAAYVSDDDPARSMKATRALVTP